MVLVAAWVGGVAAAGTGAAGVAEGAGREG